MTETYKWKATNCKTEEMIDVETLNMPTVEFEEINVWHPETKESRIVGGHKWLPLQLTEDSIEALKHVINRANGAVYFSMHMMYEDKIYIVEEAVLQADGDMFIRHAQFIHKEQE